MMKIYFPVQFLEIAVSIILLNVSATMRCYQRAISKVNGNNNANKIRFKSKLAQSVE